MQCADFLTSESEEEHVRGAKMHPLTVVGGIGQRLVSAANIPIEISAGAKSGCGFSLSRPREGRLLPSDRDANGGILEAEAYSKAKVPKGSLQHNFRRVDLYFAFFIPYVIVINGFILFFVICASCGEIQKQRSA